MYVRVRVVVGEADVGNRRGDSEPDIDLDCDCDCDCDTDSDSDSDSDTDCRWGDPQPVCYNGFA